jgi:thiamine-monophosphate kinase
MPTVSGDPLRGHRPYPTKGVGDISVSDEGEFALIRRITARLPVGAEVLLGPGDDAAVIATPDGRVVATTDLMVEGRHFRRDWSSGYDVGRKAAAANLADVVAMGARPTALLVGFGCPTDLPVEWAEQLADGLRDEAALLGATVAGGDVVAADALVVAVTALGDLEGHTPVMRSGARPGDEIVLSGWPGRAEAGLALLRAGHVDHPLVVAHRRPTPDYSTGLVMARDATAMIDVSDGLLADLGHIANASGVRLEIAAARLPIAAELSEAGRLLGVDPYEWVATGGDDHCFAATTPRFSSADVPAIGDVRGLEAGEPPRVVVIDRPAPAGGGHEHFR